MAFTDKQIATIKQNGRDAYRDGKTRRDNPHISPMARHFWSEGWWEVKRAHERSLTEDQSWRDPAFRQ